MTAADASGSSAPAGNQAEPAQQQQQQQVVVIPKSPAVMPLAMVSATEELSAQPEPDGPPHESLGAQAAAWSAESVHWAGIRFVLSGISAQNFETTFGQLTRDCDIGSVQGLVACVDVIFEMATCEHGRSHLLAEICKRLAFFKVNLPDQPQDTERQFIGFRSLLLKKCQEMFETPLTEQLEQNWVARDTDMRREHGEWRNEQVQRVTQQYRGNVRFIGQLFMKDVLTANIIHQCIVSLLRSDDGMFTELLECLCELLKTVGKKLESESNAKSRIDQYFDRIKKLINSKEIEPEAQRRLQDVVEMRLRNWEPQRNGVGHCNGAHGDGVSGETDGSARPAPLPRRRLELKSKVVLMRWLGSVCSLQEAKSDFAELVPHPEIGAAVGTIAEHLLTEISCERRQRGGDLLFELLHSQLLGSVDLIAGFSGITEMADDFLSDFPLLASYLGEIFSSFVQKAASYLACVQQLLLRIPFDLRDSSRRPLRGEILSRALHLASGRLGHDRVGAAFREAGIEWPNLLQLPQGDADEFVQTNQLEFTLPRSAPVAMAAADAAVTLAPSVGARAKVTNRRVTIETGL